MNQEQSSDRPVWRPDAGAYGPRSAAYGPRPARVVGRPGQAAQIARRPVTPDGPPQPAAAARSELHPGSRPRLPQPSRTEQQRLIAAWKRRAVVVAAVAFGGFWALAFGHPVGVTAGGARPTQSSSQAGAQPVQQAPLAPQAPQANPNPFFGGGSGLLGNGGGQQPILNSQSS